MASNTRGFSNNNKSSRFSREKGGFQRDSINQDGNSGRAGNNGNNNDNNGSGGINNSRNNRSPQVESKTILIHNINRLTLPDTLCDYFNRFGKVDKASLTEDEDENLTGAATVCFRTIPSFQTRPEIIGDHFIDGRKVHVEFIKDIPFKPFTGEVYEKASLLARSLSLGTMLEPRHFIDEWATEGDVKYNIRYTQRRMDVFFTHLGAEYKLEFKFKDIDDRLKDADHKNKDANNKHKDADNKLKDIAGGMIVEREDKTTIFTILLRYPPTYWKRNPNSRKESKRSITIGSGWERVILLPLNSSSDMTTRTDKPLLPIVREDAIDMANWLVLRITFRPSPKYAPDFERKLKQMADYNLVPNDTSMLKPLIKVTKAKDIPKPWGHIERSKLDLDFNVLYMIESAISYHYFSEYNLDEEFYGTLKKLSPEVAYGLLLLICTTKRRIWKPLFAFSEFFNQMGMKVIDKRNIPGHCAMLRKVIITPSQFYIQPPSLETTNRVIRHYRDYADRFIRVQFMDEGFNRIGPAYGQLTKENVYNRIFDVLKRGIQIGNRRYEFLAFSSSQLREQGCWFFAPAPELNADQIRSWMGVFSHEKVVAKHAVRMGQCFSSTRPVCTLQEDEVEFIPDIKIGQYTFSDGVGKITPSLAEEVAAQMDLKMVPSAFQFRLGGAKGVLTADQSLAHSSIKIQLRPSQIKFESKHLTLEVIRTSTYIHGYLNRQAITLLSALGVKDEVFMELMDNMLLDIDKIFKKPEEAIRVLLGNADEAGTAAQLVHIIQAGFLKSNDPYMCNLLNLFRVNILKDLKKKAKIIVPQGAYLLGVMDETDTLEEGEVFVQIFDSTSNSRSKQIVTGEIVVFRNPCFHPGDIRVVKAVDKPELHHLLDVIVFSAKGYRDIPSMCSGGDLDGDDYTVYWDPKLMPAIKNFTPMDYTAPPPKLVDSVRIRDIIKFFVNYINYDNLGQIANAHLATADLSPTGARDGRCILLAQLHSMAVDFPKSGKPASLTDDLIVRQFPDFMQKKDKQSYPSQKVLGRIYRAIDKQDYKEYKSTLKTEATYDTCLYTPLMVRYVGEARTLRQTYNRSLAALMNQFGVQTEAELCSGYIIKWLKKGKSKTRYEQHDYTMRTMKSFKALWRKEFEAEFCDNETKKIDWTKRHLIEAKVAAWYYVTYHPHERIEDMSVEGSFLSFPWVVYDHVCELAKKNEHRKLDQFAASQPLDEQDIKDWTSKLATEKNNMPIIAIEEEDDEEEEEEEGDDYDDSDGTLSDDDHVITFNAATLMNSPGNLSRINDWNNPSSSNSNNTINKPIRERQLQPHQSVVHSNATPEELAAALGLDLNF